ncbi:MAG: hypothetical protein A3I11_00430 [Elusimicrobia bacterium RIFCSPLOWO2_02_FULL_39_32]|nr:MAG: hypothetical protein A2034_02165 [Elusimicrobia bacterium GWA2_38_7]OGR81546.1 MAG: hypothetical protein A3B80_06410 [Elusimicrobia bacterium RIFCSPHIGHO2_02_FULL_39_36]OGR91590.1 MAG: hypothetical protein A3I11_00430 [Elusimicrobia bacterium RIFCSPLOWO2_02_FULL_39_32]OGR98817.1 MAG: hypothetical protein A3G85_08595 [Elusimicrobia bacterium RIFCSPLOWO2_12_FULL_39_28]
MDLNFSFFSQKIIERFKIEAVVPITLGMWEDRILPALSNLEKMCGMLRMECEIENKKILYIGNEKKFLDQLNCKISAIQSPQKAETMLFVFGGLTDLSILRRLKDFPDETDALELTAPWAGECKEMNSILVINPSI